MVKEEKKSMKENCNKNEDVNVSGNKTTHRVRSLFQSLRHFFSIQYRDQFQFAGSIQSVAWQCFMFAQCFIGCEAVEKLLSSITFEL